MLIVCDWANTKSKLKYPVLLIFLVELVGKYCQCPNQFNLHQITSYLNNSRYKNLLYFLFNSKIIRTTSLRNLFIIHNLKKYFPACVYLFLQCNKMLTNSLAKKKRPSKNILTKSHPLMC